MKVVKETVRKYFKYVNWTQPILTANGTMGGDSFACSDNSTQHGPVFNAFNAGNTKNVHYGTLPAVVIFYNSAPLNVTNIVWTVYDNNRNPTKYTVQGSNDGANYTPIIASHTASAGATTTMSMANNTACYKYHKIIVETFNTGVGNLKKLDITAQEIVESNASNYNTYEDVDVYKLPTKTVRTYYKYQDWVQPTLKSDGVMGGNSFAVSASSHLGGNSIAYLAFDNSELSSGSCWHSASGHPSWIQFYNPNPLNVSTIKITNRIKDGSMINSYGISYSDNGVNFTEFKTGTSPNQVLGGSFTVDTSNNGSHKYWRITSKSSSGQNNGYTAIDEIDITATELVQSNFANYDFYEDKVTYYGIGG